MVIDRQVTPDYGQNNNNNILTDRTRLSDPKLATASTSVTGVLINIFIVIY